MQGLDPTGVGGLLLLVLPWLAGACVLLTGPVAQAIGRRQHEEEQVVPAPLYVALIGVGCEVVAVPWLARGVSAGQAVPLEVGPLYFELSRFALGSVLALSALALVVLVTLNRSRDPRHVPPTGELAAVLFVWAGEVALALAGGVPTAVTALWLTTAGLSALLLQDALRQARPARVWFLAWAVVLPVLTLVVLLPLRSLDLGSDALDARTALRLMEPGQLQDALARLWLTAGLAPLLALVAYAAAPRLPFVLSSGPATVTGCAAVGALPALFRLTAGAFPAGGPAEARAWLGAWPAALMVALGLVALVVTFAPISDFRRLCLLSGGALCGLAWVMTCLTKASGHAALIQATTVALTLPYCFAALSALEATHLPSTPAPFRLARAATRLLPVVVGLLWAWFPVAGARGVTGPVVAGALLALALLAAAARLAVALTQSRAEAIAHGFFPGSVGIHALAETVTQVAWLAPVLVIGLWWASSVAHLAPPLP